MPLLLSPLLPWLLLDTPKYLPWKYIIPKENLSL
jgi:hypothetical protein